MGIVKNVRFNKERDRYDGDDSVFTTLFGSVVLTITLICYTGIVPKWYMTITMGIVLIVYYLILSQRKIF